jgi:hypothetical protein
MIAAWGVGEMGWAGGREGLAEVSPVLRCGLASGCGQHAVRIGAVTPDELRWTNATIASFSAGDSAESNSFVAFVSRRKKYYLSKSYLDRF